MQAVLSIAIGLVGIVITGSVPAGILIAMASYGGIGIHGGGTKRP
jgi:hypothetical protein